MQPSEACIHDPFGAQVKNVSIDSIVVHKESVRFTPDPCAAEREVKRKSEQPSFDVLSGTTRKTNAWLKRVSRIMLCNSLNQDKIFRE